MAVLLANNATSRLASSLTAAATTLAVTTGQGARFPSPTGDQWFPLSLVKANGALEIVKCTARSGDVFTIARAQEGTASMAFDAGDRVELRATAAVFAEGQQKTADAQQAADDAQEDVDQLGGLAVKKDANTTTGAALLPGGTQAQRPASPSNGMFRYNAEKECFEGYEGGIWRRHATNLATTDSAGIMELATPEEAAGGYGGGSITSETLRSGLNAFGAAPTYACRAWVNFDGTTNPPTIRDSGNVSSVTKNGTGDYTISFSTPMPDSNYALTASGGYSGGNNTKSPTVGPFNVASGSAYTASSIRIGCNNETANTAADAKFVNIAIHR